MTWGRITRGQRRFEFGLHGCGERRTVVAEPSNEIDEEQAPLLRPPRPPETITLKEGLEL